MNLIQSLQVVDFRIVFITNQNNNIQKMNIIMDLKKFIPKWKIKEIRQEKKKK